MRIPGKSMVMARVQLAGAEIGVATIVGPKARTGDTELLRPMRSAAPKSEPGQFSSMDMVPGGHIKLGVAGRVDAQP